MAVQEAAWVAGLYEMAAAVEAAADVVYHAVGTADEKAAVAAHAAAYAAFRAHERDYVGRSYTTACRRCGGAGGSDAWRATGWTCFDCGGHGAESRTYTKMRFLKDARKRRAEDDARAEELRERDRAFAETVAEMGAVGVALVEAAAKCYAADRAADAGYHGEEYDVDRETRFRSDLAWKLHRYGSLSEKQLAAVERGLERDRVEAEKHARATAAGRLEGTMELEGVVLSAQWKETRFGSQKKLLLELDDGRRVYGTAAASLDELRHDAEGRHVESVLIGKGDRVAFTATVEASQDDPTFGFFKRPRNARVISRATGEEE